MVLTQVSDPYLGKCITRVGGFVVVIGYTNRQANLKIETETGKPMNRYDVVGSTEYTPRGNVHFWRTFKHDGKISQAW
jgi:hypothetical protein